MDLQRILVALGGRKTVADACGLPRNTVDYWVKRGSIPPRYWRALLRLAAGIEGCPVTMDVLLEAAEHDAVPAQPVAA